MTTESSRVVVQAPGAGRAVNTAGVTLTFKAISEDTGGKYSCYEYAAPSGFGGSRPHTHPGFDEFWYVLEGELSLKASDQTVVGAAGTFVHVPGATAHAFSNASQAPVRFLGLIVPSGFERYFDELPQVVAQHGYPPPPAIMAELGRKYGIVF